MSNVPHLRFPECSGEWEKHTIGELCEEFKSGKNIKAENIQAGGVYPVFGGNGLRGYADRYNHEGDYVLIGRQGALCGNVRFVTGKTYITEHAIAAKATNNNYTHFLEYLFVRLNLGQFSDQSAQPGLAVNKLLKIETFAPSKEEQYKIASLLKFLDERIATQNKVIEDLKKLKSAISKHLFARKDLLETTICLLDIATLKNGYAFQSGKYNELGKWKILTISNVAGERYINDENCNCIIDLPNDIQDHQVLKEGDILISLTGNVGRVSLCKDGDYLLNQRVGLLQLTKNVNQEFLYQILSSQRFENSMIACSQGAAQMNIGKGDVESYVLPYSSNINNILLVATILHSYDEYIINEQRRQTLLTMQKHYLLTQMFI